MYYKSICLMTPEHARALNIPAEAPVFISGYISGTHECRECERDYSPLVYGFGRPTMAQHTCLNGGIYVYDDIIQSYFLARVDAIGRRISSLSIGLGPNVMQFEGVVLNSLLTQCSECNRHIDRARLGLGRLRQWLYPVCEKCWQKNGKLSMDYIQTEWILTFDDIGHPLFSLAEETATFYDH